MIPDRLPDAHSPHDADRAQLLDKDLMLKRLAAQARVADPSNPVACTAQVVELAHLCELELVSDGADIHAHHEVSAAGLVGHSVTYQPSDAAQVSGTVDQVCLTAQGPVLTVDGVAGVTPASLVEVR
jgi:hypothetical protein